MSTLVWIIILLAVLVVIIKLKEVKLGLIYKFVAILFFAVCISFGYVWYVSGISPFTYEGFLELSKTYYLWLGDLSGNARGITGYAVQQDWALNSTVTP